MVDNLLQNSIKPPFLKWKNSIIIFLLILFGIIIWYFLSKNQYEPKNITSVESVDQKIIDWDTENEGSFTGFYTKRKDVYGEENTGSFTCDDFVLLKKDEVIAKYFKEKYNWDLNEISIDLSKVNLTDKNRIINSTKDSPANLVLKKKIEPGKGAPACYSFFEILEVK